MNLIELKSISKIYKMGTIDVPALKKIDLKIERGDYIAVMGPSGSGKSTLMNIIGCLDIPTTGKYLLNGRNVANLNDSELAEIRNQEIGFVFQTFNLLPRLNAQKNVELPLIYGGKTKKERKEIAIELLKKVGIENRANHLPGELSGGQRQKVAIARALANNPDIILADEPTGNLDTKSGSEIMSIFDKLNKEGTTILLVTHETFIGEHANSIIHILDGEIEKHTIVSK